MRVFFFIKAYSTKVVGKIETALELKKIKFTFEVNKLVAYF